MLWTKKQVSRSYGISILRANNLQECGTFYTSYSAAVNTLVQGELEWILMYELSIQNDDLTLLKRQVNKARYLRAEIQQRVDRVRCLLTWAKILRKQGF